MATSGTYSFDPTLDMIYAEAFENAGIDMSAPGSSHLQAAGRSLALMLNSEWATLGERRWMMARAEQTMSVGMDSFFMPEGAIDIIQAVLRRQNRDTEMYPETRDGYLKIVDKAMQGRPDRWYVDRQAGPLQKKVYIWQCGSNTTDIMVYDYFRQMQDATDDQGSLAGTLQMPVHAFNACTFGLAWRLAIKFNAARAEGLKTIYAGARYPDVIGGFLKLMLEEDRERGDVHLYGAYEPRTTRR